MVLGALIRVIFGALIGLIVGVILNLVFPSFSNAITEGIHAITGADVTGQIVALMTGLGFFFGLIGAIVHEMKKR
jgi:hypothetical protein